jgi:hypothetical protein
VELLAPLFLNQPFAYFVRHFPFFLTPKRILSAERDQLGTERRHKRMLFTLLGGM